MSARKRGRGKKSGAGSRASLVLPLEETEVGRPKVKRRGRESSEEPR